MTIGTLKLARFVVPAALILIFSKVLGFLTGSWVTVLPDFSKAEFLPSVIIPSAIYYVTPLRKWVNAHQHQRVTERLRSSLVKMTGYEDKKDKYTWKKLSPLFYGLIDQDVSLKQKRDLAYWNGLLWTSFADSTVLSVLFFLGSIILHLLGFRDAILAGGIFALIAAFSFVGSLVCTKKQIDIGAEQIDVIEFKYKTDVEKRLNYLDR